MLIELTVENVAIIEKVRLDLGSGFTALTGETGAGKSLLVDAIELALGERADSDLVRSGASSAVVTAVFDLSASFDLRDACAEMGYPAEEGLLAIQREVAAEGRSTVRINGKMAPVNVLKRIGTRLVDLHGQHDHQSLLHPESHLGLLDAWIGEPALVLREQVSAQLASLQSLKTEFNRLRTGRREREARLDLLRFQIKEIQDAQLGLGELEAVESRLARLKNAERLSDFTEAARQSLEADGAARDAVRSAEHDLNQATKLDPALREALEPLQAAQAYLEEAVRSLSAYRDALEADPNELESLAERLDDLKRLVRKYGEAEADDPVATVIAFADAAAMELASLESGEQDESQLESRILAAQEAVQKTADQLTALRNEKGPSFAALVTGELRELAMERAQFEVACSQGSIEDSGQDRIEFLFSANSGEPLRPLAKIASGGELSRTMLGVKAILANKAGVPVLIFDEVDAGLSGRAAVIVGNKLQALAHHAQVIVITHLPQIAAKAACHFHIDKTESDGRVRTTVRALHGDDRVRELARLLGGEDTSEAAIANANELLSGYSPSLGI